MVLSALRSQNQRLRHQRPSGGRTTSTGRRACNGTIGLTPTFRTRELASGGNVLSGRTMADLWRLRRSLLAGRFASERQWEDLLSLKIETTLERCRARGGSVPLSFFVPTSLLLSSLSPFLCLSSLLSVLLSRPFCLGSGLGILPISCCSSLSSGSFSIVIRPGMARRELQQQRKKLTSEPDQGRCSSLNVPRRIEQGRHPPDQTHSEPSTSP
jgi:hypothetical protein